MAIPEISEQVAKELEHLSREDQQKVLDFVRALSRPIGTPGKELLGAVGAIPPEDLDAMQAAINDPVYGCERIDTDEW